MSAVRKAGPRLIQRPVKPRHRRTRVIPITLSELHSACGQHGEFAALTARWGAIKDWSRHDASVAHLSFEARVMREVATLVTEDFQFELGPPRLREQRDRPIMRRISADSRQCARECAVEIVSAWEAAGQPGLTADRIEQTYRWVLSLTKPEQKKGKAV